MDAKDSQILADRIKKWNERTGPRVGDYIYMKDGTLRRFTHHWGDSIQVTSINYGGRFYLGEGYASFSGALDPAIPLEEIAVHPTELTKDGWFWFFHHNDRRAHNGINVEAPCRVFIQR